jgi:TRAP-type C4-dicarboxylate transport system permease small subunit
VLYVTCFAAAVGVRDDRHIGVESILLLAPQSIRKAGAIVVYLGMVTFGLCMAWGGWILGAEVWPYVNPGLPISQGWSYVPLSLGGILIAMFAVERIVATMLNITVITSWH